MEAWETALAETPLACLGLAQAWNEPEISAEQIAAVLESMS